MSPTEIYQKLTSERHRENPRKIVVFLGSIEEDYCKALQSKGFAEFRKHKFVSEDCSYSVYEIVKPII